MPRRTDPGTSLTTRLRLFLLTTSAILLLVPGTVMADDPQASMEAPPVQDVAAAATEPPAPAAVDRPVPLLVKDADLKGSLDSIVVPFIVPPGEAFDRASLVLAYSNALAVLPDRSGLDVSLNGRPLATLPLIGAQGAAGASIDLPGTILQAGRNEFRFQVRQAHRLSCSRPRFEELWSKLKRDGSSLTLHRVGDRQAVDPQEITAFLAASAFDREEFMISAGTSTPDPATLDLASRVAQAVAVIRGERPLSVGSMPVADLDWQHFHGSNIAVIGTNAELGQFVTPAEMATWIDGRPFIRPLPSDPDHIALFFGGEQIAAVRRAVDGFTGMVTRPLDPPRLVEVNGAADLRLSDLGFTTQELPLGVTQPIRMQFRLPPTFYAADGQRLELALNYAYSDGMAATSALVVVVNGIAANMIRLDNPRGAIIDGARLNLTLGMFHPGINTISIQPMLDPASDAACMKPGAVLSLFDDSRISMPEFARLARGGDLQDLVDDAYPYGDEPTQVIVSGKDPATVAAAYTFLGKLAQRHGEILDNLEFVPPTSMPKDHLIAVGTPDDLPVSLLSRLDVPWRPGEDDATPVAANGSIDPTAVPVAASMPDPRESWRSRLLDQNQGDDGSLLSRLRTIMISGASAEGDGTTSVRPARPAAPGAGGAMLVEVASPWAAQKIATVLVADRPDNFQRGLAAIIAEPRWSELGGDRARWQPRDNDVISERMNATFLLQEPEPDPVQWRLMALTWLAQNRWTWLGLIIGALASASMATSLLLRMRRH